MSKKYIIIDLNQTVSRHQLEELQQEKKRDIIMGSMVFVLTAIFIWFNIINYDLSSIIEEREVRIENLNAKILNLKSEGKINLSKKDVESLYKFDAKRIFWAPKIMALTNLCLLYTSQSPRDS